MIWLITLSPLALGLLIAAALASLVSDTAAAWWLAVLLVGWSAACLIPVAQLHHWSALPRQRELPLGLGIWVQIFERLQRYKRVESDDRQDLQTELSQIHAAVDRLPDGLVVLDQYNMVEWRNNAAAQLHGLFAAGRPILHFIRDPEFSAYLEADDFTRTPPVISLASRPGRLFELRVHRSEGTNKLLLTHDITDHARLDAMRRDFVANVSHEIRTPVTVIGGFAETLLSLDLDDAARREYLSTILRQSQNMQRLVEDLLTLSSLENSTAPPAESIVPIADLLRTIAGEGEALSQGNHRIQVRVESEDGIRVAPLEFESAVRNLLTNAIRYTPEGGAIELSWGIGPGECRVTVRDSGIGIDAEHIPRLTERFYRVDRGRSRGNGGTGLGLAIVKHVLQRHDGRLEVESIPGKGSAFSLCLPKARVVPPTREPSANDQSDRAPSPVA